MRRAGIVPQSEAAGRSLSAWEPPDRRRQSRAIACSASGSPGVFPS